jgi:ABC-type multidrug transport system fused ATPase/permease subunit
MLVKPTSNLARFGRELRELLLTARQLWRTFARRHRWALLGAVSVMALGAIANTALPLLSGKLVDRVSTGMLDDGRIAETGTYAELMARDGVFAELVRCSEVNTECPRSPVLA